MTATLSEKLIARLLARRLTHAHFSPTPHQAPSHNNDEEEVIERVIAFLNEVFNDQIEFWAANRISLRDQNRWGRLMIL